MQNMCLMVMADNSDLGPVKNTKYLEPCPLSIVTNIHTKIKITILANYQLQQKHGKKKHNLCISQLKQAYKEILLACE